MAAHRYWRILIHAVGSANNWCSIGALEGRETLNGVNVFTLGVASASSIYSSGNSADKAFDGLPGTAWITSAFANGAWLELDLGVGNEKDINQVVLYPRNDGWYNQAPTNFDLQYSDDGAAWTTQFNVAIPAFTGYGSATYPPTPGIYLGKSNIAVASHPPARVSISKTNIAIASHPNARIVISKTNFAVASHGPGRILISKTNIAFASFHGIVAKPGPQRRLMFVHSVCGQLPSYNISSVSLNGAPIQIDGNTVEFD